MATKRLFELELELSEGSNCSRFDSRFWRAGGPRPKQARALCHQAHGCAWEAIVPGHPKRCVPDRGSNHTDASGSSQHLRRHTSHPKGSRGVRAEALLANCTRGCTVFTYPSQGRAHLSDLAPFFHAYNSMPPTSGDHTTIAAPCGFYRTPVPHEMQVHSLEHGVVIVQYRPDMSPENVDSMTEIVGGFRTHFILAPLTAAALADLPREVALVMTAWTRLMPLPAVDEGAMRAFYERFARRGPEDMECAVSLCAFQNFTQRQEQYKVQEIRAACSPGTLPPSWHHLCRLHCLKYMPFLRATLRAMGKECQEVYAMQLLPALHMLPTPATVDYLTRECTFEARCPDNLQAIVDQVYTVQDCFPRSVPITCGNGSDLESVPTSSSHSTREHAATQRPATSPSAPSAESPSNCMLQSLQEVVDAGDRCSNQFRDTFVERFSAPAKASRYAVKVYKGHLQCSRDSASSCLARQWRAARVRPCLAPETERNPANKSSDATRTRR